MFKLFSNSLHISTLSIVFTTKLSYFLTWTSAIAFSHVLLTLSILSPTQHPESNLSNANWIISDFKWDLSYKPSDSVFGPACLLTRIICHTSLLEWSQLSQVSDAINAYLLTSLLVSASPWGGDQCSA